MKFNSEKKLHINRKLYLEFSKITRGNLDIVKLLILLGANVFQNDQWNRNLLHIAYYNNHTILIDFLINYGVDTEKKDYFNKKPYEYYNYKNKLHA